MLLSPQGVTDVRDAGGPSLHTQQAGPRAGSTGRGWGRHRPCCALHARSPGSSPAPGLWSQGTGRDLIHPHEARTWPPCALGLRRRRGPGLRGVGPRGGSRRGLPPSLRSGLLPGEAVPPQRMLSVHTHRSTSTARAPGLPASPPCRRTMSSGHLAEPASGSPLGPPRPRTPCGFALKCECLSAGP